MGRLELPVSSTAHQPQLRAGSLSLGRAFGLGFSSLGMGAGIIAAPVGLMGAGNAAWIVYAFSMVIIVSLVVAVSSFAQRYVVTGSLMSYLGEAFGPVPRTIAGAALVFAYVMFLAGAIVYPLAFAEGLLLDFDLPWLSGTAGRIVFFCTIAGLLGSVTTMGAWVSARLAIVLTCISLPLVVLLYIVLASKLGVSMPTASSLQLSGGDFKGVIAGAVIFAGTYVGFEGFTALAAETNNPLRNIPRILAGLLAALSAGYLVATLVATPIYLQHAAQISAGQPPARILAEAAGLKWIKLPLELALVLNLLAGLVPLMNDGSRVLATAANVGILPKPLAWIDAKTRVPVRALWVLIGLSTLVPIAAETFAHAAPLETTFALAPAVFFLWMIPYMGMCLGLIVLSRRDGRLFSIKSLVGGIGFMMIAVLFCYQISHPGSMVERMASLVALSAFLLVSVVTLVRLNWRRRQSVAFSEP